MWATVASAVKKRERNRRGEKRVLLLPPPPASISCKQVSQERRREGGWNSFLVGDACFIIGRLAVREREMKCTVVDSWRKGGRMT